MVNTDMLARLVRRRWRAWLCAGAVVFAAVLLFCLFVLPQTFTGTLSLFRPQPTGPGSVLAGLGVFGSQGTRYSGVIRSRQLAMQVEAKVGLRKLYGLPTQRDAIDLMYQAVRVDDSERDGLIYVRVALPGPARLWPFAGRFRSRIKEAAAEAANAYGVALRRFVSTSDVDREQVLLRGAEDGLAETRERYDASVKRLATFVAERGYAGDDPGAAFAGGADGEPGAAPGGETESASVARELEELYKRKAAAEVEIRSVETMLQTGQQLREAQLGVLGTLPSEDPLLTRARADVNDARAERDALRVQFGPDHPRVVVSQEKLRLATQRLKEQEGTLRAGQTTDRVSSETRLAGLRAEHATISEQVRGVERKAQLTRELAVEYRRLENEVLFNLEVLKATAAQYVTLSLQTVSAKNRVAVVDQAIAPRRGTPGLSSYLIISVLLATTVVGIWGGMEYRVATCARGAAPSQAAGS